MRAVRPLKCALNADLTYVAQGWNTMFTQTYAEPESCRAGTTCADRGLTVTAANAPVTAIAFAPGGDRAAFAAKDGTVGVIELRYDYAAQAKRSGTG